jgi:PAS domain S-box-containing protein
MGKREEMEKQSIDIRYSLLVDMDDYVSIFTPACVRKFVNKSYCKFVNQKEEELLGVDFTSGMPDEKARWYRDQIAKITIESPAISLTQKFASNTQTDWVSWKATGIFNVEGVLTEIMAVGRNIQDKIELKKEKEDLLNTLNAYKNAIDTNMLCTITDIRGVITYSNEKFCKVSGYQPEEIKGKTHSIINSGYHPASFFKEMWEKISAGEMWTADIKNKAKDGSFYWVNSVIIPIKGAKDKIKGYLSLRMLINDKKRMEEERRTYQESLENMLFMVSHEIRKPIVTSQGLLYILKDELPETSEECNLFIDHLITATEELNDYSHKLNNYIQTNIQPLHVNDPGHFKT